MGAPNSENGTTKRLDDRQLYESGKDVEILDTICNREVDPRRISGWSPIINWLADDEDEESWNMALNLVDYDFRNKQAIRLCKDAIRAKGKLITLQVSLLLTRDREFVTILRQQVGKSGVYFVSDFRLHSTQGAMLTWWDDLCAVHRVERFNEAGHSFTMKVAWALYVMLQDVAIKRQQALDEINGTIDRVEDLLMIKK